MAAHSGPPFPIVQGQVAGNYEVAVWTDPDATDDGSLGGQFWVTLRPRTGSSEQIPAGTRITVAVRPLSRPGPEHAAIAAPVGGLVARQFAAVLMDHEGRFAVRVTVAGPLGPATVASEVDATYDLRPAPALFVVYLLPFVVLGLLWVKLLWRRRGLRRGDARPPAP